MEFLLACIYFYLPAGAANVGAVISRFIPIFNKIRTPVDFGKSIKGIRIVGDHKTIGGFAFGVIFGTTVGVLKFVLLDRHMQNYLILDLNFWQNLGLYLMMAFSALAGDILKSIAKRLFNIEPHKAWVPFDEIDHSTVSMTMAMIFYGISWEVTVTVITVFFFLHVIFNGIGYVLKIKSVPY